MPNPPEHNLYDASYWEIFWKNFLIGFARGLGGLAIQILFLIFAYYSFVSVVFPKIEPYLNAFVKAQEAIGKIQNPGAILDNLFKKNSNGNTPQLDSPKLTQ